MAANTAAATALTDPQTLDSDKKVSLMHEKGQYSDEKHSGDVEIRHSIVDSEPSFAEVLYWAEKRREFERTDPRMSKTKGLAQLINRKKRAEAEAVEADMAPENDDDLVGLDERTRELNNARRLLRQAGWATVFYLITCDILGPFNAPYALASIGVVPGVLLYVLFGIVAFITGAQLCRIFGRIDSVRYPVRGYGDMGRVLLGKWCRHLFSFLQTVQLILNVGLICLTNGQSLSQVSKGKLCFSVCILIWALVGMILGQIRGLQNFGVIANFSVWLNILICILTMAFVAHSAPNYTAAVAQLGPTIASGPKKIPITVDQPLFYQLQGVGQMIFAYGGAQLFPEVLAEMKRPFDFIKGMAMAQLLIFTAYVFHGVWVVAFQGQYTIPVSYQGVSVYSWQTVCNVFAMITGIIAAGLYGNIGLKIAYTYIVEEWLRGPPLMSPKGRWAWSLSVFIYWALAFIIGSAIPAVGALTSLVAYVAIVNFTYTFPPMLMLALDMRIDAGRADEAFSTPGIAPKQVDSWKSPSRWYRGFFHGGAKRVALKSSCLFLTLASLALSGMGLWASGTSLKEALAAGAATSFGCTAAV